MSTPKAEFVMALGLALLAADAAMTGALGDILGALWGAGTGQTAPQSTSGVHLTLGQLLLALVVIMVLSGLSEASDGMANFSLALLAAMWLLFIVQNGQALGGVLNQVGSLGK